MSTTKHGVSFIEVDNSPIEQAYLAKATKDYISQLKQNVAFSAVYGFEYSEVSFEQLSNILCNDYGFSPFKYTSVSEGAIYNKTKHPKAYGRVRGRGNLNNTVTWICLDIDDTKITDEETHHILSTINHHVARTSNKNNPYKYRIIIELSKPVFVNNELWKPFIKSIAASLNLVVDNLGASQVFYGYKGRKVYSTIDQTPFDPSTHLKIAHMTLEELKEKRDNALPKGEVSNKLENPYSTFIRAYEAQDGNGSIMLISCLYEARELGASKEYLYGLANAVNSFWDNSMPPHRMQATIYSFIEGL